jgi:hypothetical protein
VFALYVSILNLEATAVIISSHLTKQLEKCNILFTSFFHVFVPANVLQDTDAFQIHHYIKLLKYTVYEEHNIRRKRKTAPGLKNSLSLLKMSVQPGAAFTSIKIYKNIKPTVCLRHDKNMWTHSLSQSTAQYDVGKDLETMLQILK